MVNVLRFDFTEATCASSTTDSQQWFSMTLGGPESTDYQNKPLLADGNKCGLYLRDWDYKIRNLSNCMHWLSAYLWDLFDDHPYIAYALSTTIVHPNSIPVLSPTFSIFLGYFKGSTPGTLFHMQFPNGFYIRGVTSGGRDLWIEQSNDYRLLGKVCGNQIMCPIEIVYK